MRLRMLRTTKGAADGHTVREYLQGQEYSLGGCIRAEELARVFLREGFAEEVRDMASPAQASPAIAAEVAIERPSKRKGR